MAKWVVHGKLNFWFQKLLLLMGVLDQARKIMYGFLWDGRKGVG